MKIFNIIFIVLLNISITQQIEDKNEIVSYDSHFIINDGINIETKLSLQENKNHKIDLFLKGLYSNLKIKDEKLDYKINNQKIVINSKNNSAIKDISMTYKISATDSTKSRNFYYDTNQFFLLPDAIYLPKFEKENLITKYKTTIDCKMDYSYIDDFYLKDDENIPYIILGNFNIIKEQKIIGYVPRDVKYDSKRLQSIFEVITSSYNYFTKTFGKPKFQESFKVFFLKRTGGHGYSSGIILNQEYLKSNDTSLNERFKFLIAHEVAHLWWGNNVKITSGLGEGLAEYSAASYMQDIENYDVKNIFSNKNMQLEFSPLEKIRFDTITPYNFSNKIYKTFSYIKLPVILRELEYKIGKNEFSKKLSILYAKCNNQNIVVNYEFFNKIFDSYGNELKSDIFGETKKWADYYIKNVLNNNIVYGVKNLTSFEKLPVRIISEDNKVFTDTIEFDESKTEISKNYDYKIKKVILDPNFLLNQETSINDVYDFHMLNTSSSKYGKIFDEKFYKFSDKLIEYLFYKTDYQEFIANNAETKELISNLANSTRKIKIHGFLLSVEEKNKKIKIYTNFESSDNYSILGYITFSYVEKEGKIYLDSIDKIKL